MADSERTDDQKILDATRAALKALQDIIESEQGSSEVRAEAAKYLLGNAEHIATRISTLQSRASR